MRSHPSDSGRGPRLAPLLVAVLLGSCPAAHAEGLHSARPIPSPPALEAPARSEGDVVPIRAQGGTATDGRRASRAAALGDTIWVYSENVETLSSPSNEGGWTREDGSAQPTAWHISTVYGCEGNGFWCGRVDSGWVNDPNRFGYDNSWTQYLWNYVDLAGAVSPVTLGFKYQMDIEADFDFGFVEILDPDESWVSVATLTGVHHGTAGAPCDTFSVVLPDSIIAKYNPVQFRFVFQSDIQGSSADGAYAGDGWSIDNVTVRANLGDLRFFDDFETGPGTWTVSVFPPVGDYWRVQANVPAEQVCTANASRVWIPVSAITGALVPRQDDRLASPAVTVNRSDQVFLGFDVYRNLPLLSCFYYNIRYRTRNAGDAGWSAWLDPTSLIYFGTEKEWLRQTLALPGAAGKDSVQVRFGVKDYSQIYCDGVSTPGGTLVMFDNVSIGVVGLAGPTLQASEIDLFNDTFRTTAFYADDNFNTARGDSVSVRVGASRGLKAAAFHYRLNGGSFSSVSLAPTGPLAPTAYYADVPAGAYPRGTVLDYYFSATDSLDTTVTLPPDAIAASRYYQATVLPAIQPAAPLCAGDEANVLYVNAAFGLAAPTTIDTALAAVGLRYDRFDVNAPQFFSGNTPGGAVPGELTQKWPAIPAADLDRYTAIVWDFGERSSALLSATDQQLLQAWLGLTGRNRGLLLSGDNIAYDLVVNTRDIGTFLSCTLGATYLRDVWETSPQDSLSPLLVGASGTFSAGDAYAAEGACPSVNRFDALGASPCGGSAARMWTRYPANLMAAVERRDALGVSGDSAKSVLLAVNLAALAGPVPRNVFLWRTLVQEFETPYCFVPTGVEVARAGAPAARPVLHGASPNPFNPSTEIRFTLARPARARLFVFDVGGALVRSLADGPFGAGSHAVLWDGRDERGRDLASGAYFCRLEADGAREARKLILLR